MVIKMAVRTGLFGISGDYSGRPYYTPSNSKEEDVQVSEPISEDLRNRPYPRRSTPRAAPFDDCRLIPNRGSNEERIGKCCTAVHLCEYWTLTSLIFFLLFCHIVG